MSTFRHTIQTLITVFATITCSSGAAAATPFPELDSVICTLMRRYDLPAASIALMRDDRIIYTAAYGVTDTLRHTPTPIRTRFRIASLSKPVTMAGILLLAAQGRLSLDDRVFGEGAILGTDYGPVPRGSGKDLITVRNLLEHKSGWENIPDDPMFSNAGATQRQIIARMLAARPLSAPAGEKYSYSNFGYLVLGRIIEKVSGMPYGKFIRRHVLRPCGIRRMRIGEAHPRHTADGFPRRVDSLGRRRGPVHGAYRPQSGRRGYNTRLARVSVLFRVRALDTYRLPARHGGRNDTHRRQVFIRAALKQTLLRRTILGRSVANAHPCHNRPLNPYTRNRPPPLDRYTMIIHGGMHRVHTIYKKQIFPSLTIIISDKK